MKPIEQRFEQLRTALDALNTDARRTRMEQGIRSAWIHTHTSPMYTFRQRIMRTLPYASLSVAIVCLAVFTAQQTKESAIDAEPATLSIHADTSSEKLEQKQKVADYSFSDTELSQKTYGSRINLLDDISIAPPISFREDETYTYGNNQQLFDESVALGIETRENILSTTQHIRDAITEAEGTLIRIYGSKHSATLQAILDPHRLSTIEQLLAELDMGRTVTTHTYSIENVSSEVAIIDEDIASAQSRIDTYTAKLNGNISDTERKRIETYITSAQKQIEQYTQAREDIIKAHSQIRLAVYITHYQPFWALNYQQYDRETYTGAALYEVTRALRTVTYSTGPLLTIIVWIAVYTAMLTPFFILVRFIARKIIRYIRRKKDTLTQ